jgi:hypothetical protein
VVEPIWGAVRAKVLLIASYAEKTHFRAD